MTAPNGTAQQHVGSAVSPQPSQAVFPETAWTRIVPALFPICACADLATQIGHGKLFFIQVLIDNRFGSHNN
jgi:hypothetical protein